VLIVKVQLVDIKTVIPYARNPRKNQEAVSKVAASIKEFGFKQPIVVDSENVVIAGHTRLMAAQQLDIKKVPIVVADDLTDAQVKAYRIADNRVSQEAEWDYDLLKLEMDDLVKLDFSLDYIGFNEQEIDTIFQKTGFDPAFIDEQGKLDELDPIYINCPHCGKEFDQRAA
jgi:ParB family chromosome partitioning protein